MTRRHAVLRFAAAICLIAANASLPVAASGPPPLPDERAQPISALVSRRAEIAHVRVLHLSSLVTTYAAIAPQLLETHSGIAVTRESGRSIEAILTHLRSADVGPAIDGTIDARWAFIFERSDRSRVGSIYLDEFGRTIATPERAFHLGRSSSLYAWLHARYGRDGVVR